LKNGIAIKIENSHGCSKISKDNANGYRLLIKSYGERLERADPHFQINRLHLNQMQMAKVTIRGWRKIFRRESISSFGIQRLIE
jgi:hypothetical protein